jgi:hypothetical protein
MLRLAVSFFVRHFAAAFAAVYQSHMPLLSLLSVFLSVSLLFAGQLTVEF